MLSVKGCFPLIDQATQEYIKDLVLTYREKGYDYYLVYSVYYRSSLDSRPDYYLVFSEDEITTEDGYSYTLPANRVALALRRSPDDSELSVEPATVLGTIRIGNGIFCYTNSTNTGTLMQPDIIVERGVPSEAFYGVALCFGIVLAVVCISRCWRWFGVG